MLGRFWENNNETYTSGQEILGFAGSQNIYCRVDRESGLYLLLDEYSSLPARSI
jgi:hypothetical protein